MKNNFHNQIRIINYMTSTERFKIIFVMTIGLVIYGCLALCVTINNFFNAAIFPFLYSTFNIFLFSLLLLNTLNTCSTFSNDFSSYIIRLKNKNCFIKELIKNTIIMNIFYLILFFLLYFMLLLLLKGNEMNVEQYLSYNINNLLYGMFYLFRYVLIGILFSIISALLYVNFKSTFTIIMDTLFLIGFEITSFVDVVRNTFTIIPWHYFDGTYYSTFITELCFSTLFIFILEVVILILKHFTLRNKRWSIS